MKKIIIGIVGLPGAGKSTIAAYLARKGFVGIKLSSFLEKEAKNNQITISRQSLQDIGNQVRKKYGPAVLAQWALKRIGTKQKAVIDGIRNLAEIKFLKKQGNFFLLGITARAEIRYRRLLKVKTRVIPKWEDFLRLDARDKGKGQSSLGLQLNKCLKQADLMIENNAKNQKELYKIVDDSLSKL